MENQDTGFTKSEFKAYIFENMKKFQNGDGEVDKTPQDTLWGALFFILVWVIFMSAGLLILKYEWFSFWALLFTLFPLLHISVATWVLLQIQVYSNLWKYFDTKELLLQKDTLIKGLISKDMEDITINPLEVMSFVDTLSDITAAYSYILSPLSVAIEWRAYFKKDAQIKLLEFVERERLWLLQYTISYRDGIYLWLNNHQRELENTKAYIGSLSNETRDWINVLKTASVRLDWHIESIEKVRIKQ